MIGLLAALWALAAGLAGLAAARGMALRRVAQGVRRPAGGGGRAGGPRPAWLAAVLWLPAWPRRGRPDPLYGKLLALAGLDLPPEALWHREVPLAVAAGAALLGGWGAAAAWAGAAVGPATAVTGAAAGALAGPLALRLWLRRAAAARQDMLLEQLPPLVDLLVLGLESGLTVRQVLALASRHAPGAWRDVCARMLAQVQHGLAPERVEAALRATLAPGPCRAVVRALGVVERAGVSQVESLRREGTHARALWRRRWQAEVDALPLQLLLVGVLLLFPPVLVVLLLPNLLIFAGSRW